MSIGCTKGRNLARDKAFIIMDQGGMEVDKQKKTGRGEHGKRRLPEPRRDAAPAVDLVDLESDQSFPASDPPSHTSVTRDGRPMN